MPTKDFEKVEEKVAGLVEESLKFAEESPNPEPGDMYSDVFVMESR